MLVVATGAACLQPEMRTRRRHSRATAAGPAPIWSCSAQAPAASYGGGLHATHKQRPLGIGRDGPHRSFKSPVARQVGRIAAHHRDDEDRRVMNHLSCRGERPLPEVVVDCTAVDDEGGARARRHRRQRWRRPAVGQLRRADGSMVVP
eukprot:scaffold3540_cov379-Prasinococcus_capsulatus_cf.AAC.15